jgi:hypothetical protein
VALAISAAGELEPPRYHDPADAQFIVSHAKRRRHEPAFAGSQRCQLLHHLRAGEVRALRTIDARDKRQQILVGTRTPEVPRLCA